MSIELSQDLLAMLVCPVSHGALRYDPETHELISDQANLAYPIRDGIPVMLAEEARSLSLDEEKNKFKD